MFIMFPLSSFSQTLAVQKSSLTMVNCNSINDKSFTFELQSILPPIAWFVIPSTTGKALAGMFGIHSKGSFLSCPTSPNL